MWHNKNPHSVLVEMHNEIMQPLQRTVWQFLTRLIIVLLYDPAITHLGIHPKEMKTYVHTKTCPRMFIAALFIITKTWNKPRCPSVGEWISKLQYIQIVEYYSVLKRNELSSHERTWRTIKSTLLSERANLKRLHPILF